MKNILVPIADGSEEMESTIIIDVLRRAGGNVIVASVSDDNRIVASRGVNIVADVLLKDVSSISWDLIACPGGGAGAINLSNSKMLIDLLKKQNNDGKLIGAICASPAVIFSKHSLLKSKATCYPAPAFIDQLGDKYVENQKVVIDENIITSVGPGTTFEFALELVSQLYGDDRMKEVRSALCL